MEPVLREEICSTELRHPHDNLVRFRIFCPIPWREETDPFECCSCTLPSLAPSVPVRIVRSIGPDGTVDVLPTVRCCTLSCALRHIIDEMLPHIFAVLTTHVVCSQWNMKPTLPAPSRLRLVEYGGDMTRDEMRDLCGAPLRDPTRIPSHVMSTTGVREVYFGAHEGGRGEEEILRDLEVRAAECLVGMASSDPPSRCANCGMWFRGEPVRAPKAKLTYGPYVMEKGFGFCAAPCMLRYVIGIGAEPAMVGRALHVAVRTYGTSLRFGRPSVAPHRLQRRAYGGDLPDDEFRLLSAEGDFFSSLLMAPFLSSTTQEAALFNSYALTADMSLPFTATVAERERAAEGDSGPQESVVWGGLFENIIAKHSDRE